MALTLDAANNAFGTLVLATQQQVQIGGVAVSQGLIRLHWKSAGTGTVYARLGSSGTTLDAAAANPAACHDLHKENGAALIWLKGRTLALAASVDTDVSIELLPDPWG